MMMLLFESAQQHLDLTSQQQVPNGEESLKKLVQEQKTKIEVSNKPNPIIIQLHKATH